MRKEKIIAVEEVICKACKSNTVNPVLGYSRKFRALLKVPDVGRLLSLIDPEEYAF